MQLGKKKKIKISRKIAYISLIILITIIVLTIIYGIIARTENKESVAKNFPPYSQFLKKYILS